MGAGCIIEFPQSGGAVRAEVDCGVGDDVHGAEIHRGSRDRVGHKVIGPVRGGGPVLGAASGLVPGVGGQDCGEDFDGGDVEVIGASGAGGEGGSDRARRGDLDVAGGMAAPLAAPEAAASLNERRVGGGGARAIAVARIIQRGDDKGFVRRCRERHRVHGAAFSAVECAEAGTCAGKGVGGTKSAVRVVTGNGDAAPDRARVVEIVDGHRAIRSDASLLNGLDHLHAIVAHSENGEVVVIGILGGHHDDQFI